MRRAALLGAICVLGCARRTTPDASPPATSPPSADSSPSAASPPPAPEWHSEEGSPPDCDLEPENECGAGKLPRITDRSWSAAEIAAMVERSKAGTVAVEWSASATRLVPQCKLEGAYAGVRGETGSGVFKATDHLIFLPSELGPGCATATHLVAAFVQLDGHFSAVLVPLPCPPSTDSGRATGCVGRGLTGRERRARADEMIHEKTSPEVMEISHALEVYSLWPDERLALSHSLDVGHKQRFDCFVVGQMEARLSTERLSSLSRFAPDVYDCAYRPPFTTCFEGLFDPAPAGPSCWLRPEH